MKTTSLSDVDGVLHLKGEVTFATVPHLTAKLDKLLSADVVALDCGAVTQVDSSAIAFLLYGLRLARQKKIPIKIVSVQDQMKVLMGLYGVSELCFPGDDVKNG